MCNLRYIYNYRLKVYRSNKKKYIFILQTPLFFAAHSKHKEIVKLLIEYGADANITNHKNETVLKAAKGEEYKKFLKSK